MIQDEGGPAETKKSISELLKWAFVFLWRDRLAVLAIAILYTITYMLLFLPLAGLQPPQPGMPPDPVVMRSMFLWMIPIFLFFFFLAAAIFMLISRLIVLGRSELFSGGLRALVGRTFRVLWRMICAGGWMMLVMLSVMLIMSLVFFLVGLIGSFGGSASIAGGVVGALVPFALIIGVFAFYVIMNFALICESLDKRMPIHTSFATLRGNLARPAVAMFVLYIGVILIFAVGIGTWLVMGGTFIPETPEDLQNMNRMFQPGIGFYALSVLMSVSMIAIYYCFVAITAIATEKHLNFHRETSEKYQ